MSIESYNDSQFKKFKVKYKKLVEEKIKNHGHFIQGVLDSISYTVGLSGQPGKDYELFTDSPQNLLPCLMNDTSVIPGHKQIFEMKGFVVKLSDNSEQPSRAGYYEITDPDFIELLATHYAKGWESFGYRDKINKVFYVTYADVNNKLFWEIDEDFENEYISNLKTNI